MPKRVQGDERITTRIDISSLPIPASSSNELQPSQSLPPATSDVLQWTLTFQIGLDAVAVAQVRIVTDQTILIGRADAVDRYFPDLDFAPYGARDAGISRRHAHLVAAGNCLYLADLASVNGTWINGVRLAPNQYFTLHDGAIVDFGMLRTIVHFV